MGDDATGHRRNASSSRTTRPVVVTATFRNRSASTVVDVEERDIRRPVSIVGRLPRTAYTTAEVWVHPNGKVAYLGTHGGGDRVYTIDISNPASPTVVDSVVMNTRLVNDVMTDKEGKVLMSARVPRRKNASSSPRSRIAPSEGRLRVPGRTAGVTPRSSISSPNRTPLSHGRRHGPLQYHQPPPLPRSEELEGSGASGGRQTVRCGR